MSLPVIQPDSHGEHGSKTYKNEIPIIVPVNIANHQMNREFACIGVEGSLLLFSGELNLNMIATSVELANRQV